MEVQIPSEINLRYVINITLWGIISLASGAASFLNSVLNSSEIAFSFTRLLMRAFVGLVVGTTAAYIIYIKAGEEWALPASSISAWFSTETMNILGTWIKKRAKTLK
jgi:hypothetical protein